MKSSAKVIKSTESPVFQVWNPQEIGNEFGVEMHPHNGNGHKPTNGNGNGHKPLNGNGRHHSMGAKLTPSRTSTDKKSSALECWLPPELDFSLSPDMAGNLSAQEADREHEENDIAAMVRTQKMISSTETRIAQMLQQAEQEAQQIKDEAYKQGLANANAETDQLLRATRMIADEMHAWRESMIAQSEETIINLVLDIGRALFGSGFILDNNRIKDVYTRAINDAKNLGNLAIRLHPEDADLLENRWLQEQAHFSQSIKLVPDSKIKRGGCLIEGEFGQVDASIDSQFEVISDKINDVLVAQSAQKYTNQFPNPDSGKGKLPGNFGG